MEAPAISDEVLARYAGDANVSVGSVDVVVERVGAPPAKR
jgi:hypothetical protein